MHERAQEFVECARERYGIELDVHEFQEGTQTAAAAATAIGCETGQIASSIALVADELVVAVISGPDRVDTRKLATLRGVHEARMAEPEDVREMLGWAIGGVPPFCHETQVPVYIDEALLEYDTVWAAAGTPQAVFPIAPERIREFAEASIVDISE